MAAVAPDASAITDSTDKHIHALKTHLKIRKIMRDSSILGSAREKWYNVFWCKHICGKRKLSYYGAIQGVHLKL